MVAYVYVHQLTIEFPEVSVKQWSVLGAMNQTPDMDPVLPVGCAASLTRSQLVLNIRLLVPGHTNTTLGGYVGLIVSENELKITILFV